MCGKGVSGSNVGNGGFRWETRDSMCENKNIQQGYPSWIGSGGFKWGDIKFKSGGVGGGIFGILVNDITEGLNKWIRKRR